MIAIFPKLAEAAAKGDLEQLTCLVRLYFVKKKPFSPQVDITEVYHNLTIPIRRLTLEGVAALACRDEGGRFSVAAIVNPRFPPGPSERFLLAHLLGHFFLHVQPQILRGEWNTHGIGIDENPEMQYSDRVQVGREDRLANEFAAALLLPKSQLLKAAETLGVEAGLAKFFGVGTGVLNHRLESLTAAAQPKSVAKKPGGPRAKPEPQQDRRLKGMERLRQIAKNLDKGP